MTTHLLEQYSTEVQELAISLAFVKNLSHNTQYPGECLVYKSQDQLDEAQKLIDARPHKFKANDEIVNHLKALGLNGTGNIVCANHIQVELMKSD